MGRRDVLFAGRLAPIASNCAIHRRCRSTSRDCRWQFRRLGLLTDRPVIHPPSASVGRGMAALLEIIRDLRKPEYGTPCNGCGVCCALAHCGVATMLFQPHQLPCPALAMSRDRTRFVCSLIEAEIENGMEPVIQTTLGVGLGCSMEDDTQQKEFQ